MTHFLRLCLAVFCLSLVLAVPGRTQDTDESAAPPVAAEAESPAPVAVAAPRQSIDYAVWNATALRAEEAILAARASNLALEQLREELAGWRSQFLEAQEANATRIATLNEQIAALGAAPEDGATEAPEIAQRRAELNAQRDVLMAPVLTAEEAYSRADGLIGEIDAIIRTRQTDQLLQLGPSPLNPAHWPKALGALGASVRLAVLESKDAIAAPNFAASLRGNLPAVVFYLALAAVLLLRGRRWMVDLTTRLAQNSTKRGAAVFAGLISVGQIILPLLGLLALLEAFYAAEVLGLRGAHIAGVIPGAGVLFLAGLWLAGRLFPRASLRAPMFTLSEARMAEARRETGGLAAVAGCWFVLQRLAAFDAYEPAELAVLTLPLLIIAGVLMFRIAQILMIHVRNETDADNNHPYRDNIIQLVARAVMLVAFAGPVLGAIGYFQAAVFFTLPAIHSLALLGLVVALQRFVYDAYALLMGAQDGVQDALMPVLIGFVLFLVSIPVLALIWGVRVADLTELWTRFTEGFQLGDTRLSPSDFLTFAIIFAALYFLTRLFQGALRATILPKTKIDKGGQNAIVSGTGYLGIFLAAIIAITATGIDLSSVAIVAGALSVGIGFGLQNIVSNFVSGIILLIERPVTEGDWIEVGGVMGTVRDISVRSTRVETFDRTDVIVPNTDLISGMVTNFTRSNVTGRIILKIGVAYGTDTRKVHALLEEIAQSHPIVIVNPPPHVSFAGFGADSLDFEVRCVLSDINFGLTVRSELNHEIARRFAEEVIEIPFAQRDIWLRNPEALRGEAPAAQTVAAPAPATPQDLPKDFREDPDGDR